MDKKMFSTSEVAKLLGISRIAVFKKVKSGEIKAQRIGRSFVIDKNDLPSILGKSLTKSKKQLIERAVKKTVDEYRETLKMLGQE
ncbi:MAG: helix-turn-helix domain-containing protein [Candidatus Paceibacterota bacterium]|jgi:excisionase family DNA binding protein